MGAHRVNVTEVLRAPAQPDYAGAFAVACIGADARGSEQWVRAVLEEAPPVCRALIVTGWKYVLGLRLGPRSTPTSVLGWKIVSNTPTVIALEVNGPLVAAHKVLRVEPSRVVLTTFVHYERPAGRIVWRALAPVHHRTEPYLLGRAASRLGIDAA